MDGIERHKSAAKVSAQPLAPLSQPDNLQDSILNHPLDLRGTLDRPTAYLNLHQSLHIGPADPQAQVRPACRQPSRLAPSPGRGLAYAQMLRRLT